MLLLWRKNLNFRFKEKGTTTKFLTILYKLSRLTLIYLFLLSPKDCSVTLDATFRNNSGGNEVWWWDQKERTQTGLRWLLRTLRLGYTEVDGRLDYKNWKTSRSWLLITNLFRRKDIKLVIISPCKVFSLESFSSYFLCFLYLVVFYKCLLCSQWNFKFR